MSVVSLDEILSDYFSDAALLQAWGKVEAILAAKQAALGMIPQDAADKIVKVLREAKVDPQEVLRLKEKIGHPLIPYLRLVEEA